jgi:capsular polysaccharide export protein
MINQGFAALRGKRVLLLQGPVGPFFARLAHDMRGAGAQVFKVNFNGGDWAFSPASAFARVFNFTGHSGDWDSYLDALVKRLGIDVVILFGDCRPMHVTAIRVAKQNGIEVGVFEEGYLRPDHITLERDGVNSHSSVPDNPAVYREYAQKQVPPTRRVGDTFGYAALWAMCYYVMASLLKPFFWNYVHHRRLTFLEGLYWVRSYTRKQHYARFESGIQDMLVGTKKEQYFLVPLQASIDSQVRVHSDYASIEQFIAQVAESFAKHAPTSSVLVFKHHPIDRGYTDYTRLLAELTDRHGLHGRCFYVHDLHLPTLLDNARGVVTINSTVGISALQHRCPVKVCGQALYDIQGLTFQGTLAQFWGLAHVHVPDPVLVRGFRNYLILHTQHNGSFYKKLPGIPLFSGINWTERSADSVLGAAEQEHELTAMSGGSLRLRTPRRQRTIL